MQTKSSSTFSALPDIFPLCQEELAWNLGFILSKQSGNFSGEGVQQMMTIASNVLFWFQPFQVPGLEHKHCARATF